MTTEEFNNTRFGLGTVVEYFHVRYWVIGVDFELKRLHLKLFDCALWADCSECKIVNP